LPASTESLTVPPERRPRCYVVSLKYSPGLAKEFLLFGDELARRGLQPVFLVSREYEWLMPPEAETHYLVERSDKGTVLRSVAASTASVVARIRSAWREHPPVLLLLYNFHPLNLVLTALALRYSPRGLRALFLHEPHVAHKLEFFGVRGGAVVAAVEAGQKAVLRMCNEVIFPSPNAQSQFERLAPWFRGHRRVAALLVPDSDEAAPQERRVVGFYGHMDNRNKGLADFTRLLEAAGRTLHPPRFRLETATNLKTWHDALSPAARMCLELVQRKQLTDANIDQAMSRVLRCFCCTGTSPRAAYCQWHTRIPPQLSRATYLASAST
jgi:hypothetical protein